MLRQIFFVCQMNKGAQTGCFVDKLAWTQQSTRTAPLVNRSATRWDKEAAISLYRFVCCSVRILALCVMVVDHSLLIPINLFALFFFYSLLAWQISFSLVTAVFWPSKICCWQERIEAFLVDHFMPPQALLQIDKIFYWGLLNSLKIWKNF